MVLLLAAGLWVAAQAVEYELVGTVEPSGPASVHVDGATSPFAAETLADVRGRFRIRGLAPGDYTVAVFLAGRGEARQTIDVGPGTADRRRRVIVTLRIGEGQIQRDPRHGTVSARELAVPEKARREYLEAQKLVAKRDTAGAVKRLEHAVELAPQFAVAWNHLGTIAYQTGNFARAEECFRTALKAEPDAYEPLVNLGGALLSELKLSEALEYNLYAVLARPNDALANSQLGLTYFHLDKLDFAEKYLKEAVRLDPGHFSHPQLALAEIQLRRGRRTEAAAVLEDFVRRHPDWPAAARMRDAAAKLRASP